MGKTWVSCRLSENAMSVIQSVVSRTNCVGKAEAIEYIIRKYQKFADKPIRRFFHLNNEKVKPLEAYASAE